MLGSLGMATNAEMGSVAVVPDASGRMASAGAGITSVGGPSSGTGHVDAVPMPSLDARVWEDYPSASAVDQLRRIEFPQLASGGESGVGHAFASRGVVAGIACGLTV